MRITAVVNQAGPDAWQVEVCVNGGDPLTHCMRREKRGTQTLCWPHSPAAVDLDRAFQALERIANRRPESDDMAILGEVLRQALLGPCWPQLVVAAGQRPVWELLELALEWSADAGDLTGLPWELLHDDDGFMLLRHPRPVTVTRIVAEAHTEPLPVDGIPRVLFAIGVDLADPQILPGAELMGLLSETDDGVAVLYPLVLEQASIAEIAVAAARFKPDVVHLICHGDVDETGGFVLLKDPERPGQFKPAYGDQLALAVCGAGQRPLMVLSACKGAAAGGPASLALAASLVRHGAPAAVAMSGTVRDQACRLFARSFVKALVAGQPLGEAVAHGRCAAYFEGGSAGASLDWAYPTVFCSTKVRADTVFVHPRPASRDQISQIRALGFSARPLFFGRADFMKTYRLLVEPDTELSVLVIEAAREPGLGENRLLKEFGALAIRQGHLPLHVKGPANGRQPKKSFLQVALKILSAALLLGEKLQFTLTRSELLGLLDTTEAAAAAAETDPRRRRFRYSRLIDAHFDASGELNQGIVRQALSIDLAQLLDDARQQDLAGQTSQAVVLLAGVDQWDRATTELTDAVDQFGLGGDCLAPVVMTWVRGQQDVALAALSKDKATRPYIEVMPLKPFGQDEALLASEWMLMHAKPNDDDQRDYLPCVITDSESRWRRLFWRKLRGYPGRMLSPDFISCAESAVEFDFAQQINDEERLSRYLAQLGSQP